MNRKDNDGALKELLRSPARETIRAITGTAIESWLDVELKIGQSRRADLLGETADGSLIHLELQRENDKNMPLRMAEYCLGIYRLLERFPRQICLYVGQPPMRMPKRLKTPGGSFGYSLIDVRTLDSDGLLESPHFGDNVIAVLTRLPDEREAIRRMIEKSTALPRSECAMAMHALLTLAGLRGLEAVVEEEIQKMPVLIDIMKNEVLGPVYRKGRDEGREEGRQKGRQDGEIAILRRLIAARFGRLPAWAGKRLAAKSTVELEELSVRVLSASSIRELLK
ncbi:MAG TPA: DUF4351 domain-containing protein [Candidatus Solibacter sp.]|nr:DUF4351 domain-containing protein [Candidatus Solibacter sp.]